MPVFVVVIGRPLGVTLFPYTTLFRSPAGKPLRATEPVATAQVGCVIVPTIGAVADGCALIPTVADAVEVDRKSTRLNSSHDSISYPVFFVVTVDPVVVTLPGVRVSVQ